MSRVQDKLPGASPIAAGIVDSECRLVRAYDPNENNWEAILAECSNISFFHSRAWARVLSETYGYSPIYFVCRDGAQFVIPCMEVKSYLTGTRGVCLPFTDACSVEGINPGMFRRAVSELTRHGAQRGWKYWEFHGGADLLPEAPRSTEFLKHRLRLQDTDEKMFARFSSSARTAVRKAESEGVKVEISREIGPLKSFYELLCRTRKRHGSPPQPFEFFENLHREVLARDLGFVALARHGDQPAAGVCFFTSGTEAIYKYAASDDRLQQYRASNLALWHGIRHLIKRGTLHLDFGRTSLCNTGLQRFKRAWGADESRLAYLRYDYNTKSYVTRNDPSTQWHTLIFKHVSPRVGKIISRFLYRHAA